MAIIMLLTRLATILFILKAPAFAADQFIVRAPAAYLQELANRFSLTIAQKIPGQDTYLVLGPEGVSPDEVIRRLHNYDHGGDADDDDDDDDDVSVEINTIVSLPEPGPGGQRLITNTAPVSDALRDTSYANYHGDFVWSGYIRQPALTRVRVLETHAQYATGAGIIAVIDTGIDPDHPVLKNWLVPGYDFVRELAGNPSELDDLDPETKSILSPYSSAILDTFGETNPYTSAILDHETASRVNPNLLPSHFGHGTMVAGLVRLVAPYSRIMPLKPFGGDGRATLFNILRAVYYAEANGAKVINMSFSLTAPSEELQQAIEFVAGRGVICTASAGNQGLETLAFPAAYKEVIGVASTNMQDIQSPFTNHGDNLVTLAAPGEALIAPYPGGFYAAAWGTSFSAPLVSGTVGLMIQVKPSINWELAEAGLKEASPVEGNLGNGRLDVYRAVDKATQF